MDTPLFAATANPLQLCHSPRAKILAFKVAGGESGNLSWKVLYTEMVFAFIQPAA